MKTLQKFLLNTPSYLKCGNETISKRSGITLSTVAKFKKTELFKELKNSYINKNNI